MLPIYFNTIKGSFILASHLKVVAPKKDKMMHLN